MWKCHKNPLSFLLKCLSWKKWPLVTLSFSFFLNTAKGQKSNLSFESLTSSDGLSSNSINCIYQNSEGFLWVGSQNGLNRFDGYSFLTYKNNPGDSNSLSNNIVTSIQEDKEGLLWIGTLKGLNVFNPSRRAFANQVTSQAAKEIGNDRITSIYISRSEIIWIGTYEGLASFNPSTKKFRSYKNEKGFLSYRITAIAEDGDGTLWVGTDKGLHHVYCNGNNILSIKTYVHDKGRPGSISNNFINTIYKNITNTIWIGTEHGLNKLIRKTKDGLNTAEFIAYTRNNNDYIISHNDVKCIIQDKEGNLWVGTRGGGLNKVKRQGDGNIISFEHFQNVPQNPNSLVQNEVFAIFQDNADVIWAGTYNGLSKIKSLRTNFIRYQHDPFNNNSLLNNNVAAILTYNHRKNENILLGTSGGVNRIRPKNVHQEKEDFFSFATDNGDFTHLKVQSLFFYAPDVVWVGTKKNLRIYNLSTKKFLKIPYALQQLPTGSIRKVYRDKTGLIWIGGNMGLFTWNDMQQELTHLSIPSPQSLSNSNNNETNNYIELSTPNNIYAIEEDNAGNIWVGTWGGGLINFKSGKPQLAPVYYIHKLGDNKTISSNYVTALYFSRKGQLWIGTANGLNLFWNIEDKVFKKATFTHFAKIARFNNTHIAGILEDDHGRLWLATTTGISQFHPGTNQVLNYHFSFGNITKENYTMGICKDSYGYMYFGGMSGFLSFHPDSIHIQEQSYPLVITDLQINDRKGNARPVFNRATLIKDFSSDSGLIHLTYKDYAFSFSFASLNYYLPEKIHYAFLLEGIDKGWIYRNANQRFASYSNLRPGTYVLKVKATDAYGNWTDPCTLLTIQVLTPFWTTWWAYILYACFISFILFKTGTYIISRERLSHNLKVVRLEKERVKEMEELKLQYFTNISHEFRTPLTLIKAPLEQLFGQLSPIKDRQVLNNLTLIQHSVSHLLRLINQLLDFRKAEDGKLQLKVSQNDLIEFVDVIKDAFLPLANNKSIGLEIKTSFKELNAWCDWDKLEKILNNLIYNAISFCSTNGMVTIEIKTLEGANNNAIIAVRDTGTGIAKKEIEKIFEVFYQADNAPSGKQAGYGIGLSLTKKLVELHKGSIRVESEPDHGATFTIIIPISICQYNKTEISEEVTANKTDLQLPVKHTNPRQAKNGSHTLDKSRDTPSILIVEDNTSIRNYLVDCFHDNYVITEAEDGRDALEKARKNSPDLIISDVLMPNMDGNEFCREIKTNIATSHIPVILLTALDSTLHIIEGLETGADAYVTKPFQLAELKVRVKKIIESRIALRKHFTNQALTEPKEVTVNSADEKFLREAVKMVEDHISEDYSVDDFVNDMLVGRSILYRKLKQLTDQSPNEFIRTVRLKRAAQLLKQQAGNISEICYQVGFTDPGYFAKCFRKQFSVTPKEFVVSHQYNNGKGR